MILYICELCGKWLDVSLSKMIADAFKKIPGIEQQSGQACPSGCGLMRRVEMADRLCIIEDIRSSAAGRISFTHDGKHFRGELFEVEK